MTNMCKDCGHRPVLIKKHRLCSPCYQRERRRNRNVAGGGVIRHDSEINFVKNFFIHNNWRHHPVIFRLDSGNYEPDFYDGERDMYIEVVGTRQAFDANREKYKEFIKTFPKVGFEIRKVSGEIVDLKAGRQSWT